MLFVVAIDVANQIRISLVADKDVQNIFLNFGSVNLGFGFRHHVSAMFVNSHHHVTAKADFFPFSELKPLYNPCSVLWCRHKLVVIESVS